MCREAPSPPWLESDWLLRQFGDDPEEAIKAYRRFVETGKDRESVWTGLRNEFYLGSDAFVEEMQALVNSEELRGVSRSRLRPLAKPLSWFQENFPNRYEAMARAYLSGAYSMATVAAHFGVHYTTVSRAVRQFEP